MTKYARIIDSVAVEILIPPEGFTLAESVHSAIAELFSEVPDDVTVNSTVDAKGKWTITPVIEPEPIVPVINYPIVTPLTFQMLFTSKERIAIKTAVKTDPIIEDWWSIVTNPQLTEVDLGLTSVQEALTYLISLSIITEDREKEILTGKVK